MLIAIFGKMGSGKTLIMSYYGQKYFKKKVPIYSNYNLLNSIEVNNKKDLLNIENGVICLDELWVSADSRLWKDNVFLTHWIMQTRKKNLIVFYTTQHFGQIDKRIRNATDKLIFCEHMKKKKIFRYTILSGTTNNIIRSFKMTEKNAERFYNVYNSFQVIKPLLGVENRNYSTKNWKYTPKN